MLQFFITRHKKEWLGRGNKKLHWLSICPNVSLVQLILHRWTDIDRPLHSCSLPPRDVCMKEEKSCPNYFKGDN